MKDYKITTRGPAESDIAFYRIPPNNLVEAIETVERMIRNGEQITSVSEQ